MLDVIEHLNRPEAFLEELRQRLSANPSLELIISTGNVGFFITRAMLFVGQFNYGKRGVLDMTHTRLFTFSSMRRALQQAGFDILETTGVPGPYPLAIATLIAVATQQGGDGIQKPHLTDRGDGSARGIVIKASSPKSGGATGQPACRG
jgi:hypothetical protein